MNISIALPPKKFKRVPENVEQRMYGKKKEKALDFFLFTMICYLQEKGINIRRLPSLRYLHRYGIWRIFFEESNPV